MSRRFWIVAWIGAMTFGACTRTPSPPSALPELSALEVLPEQVTAVVWGPPEIVVWGHDFRFVPALASVMGSMVRELDSLGVPRERLEQITIAMNLEASPVEWLFLLDGQWKAREVVRGKRELHGDPAEVDLSGELGVMIRDGLLFSSAGAGRIAVGTPSLVRSCVSTMQAGGGSLPSRIQEISSSLPEAPLHLVMLARHHYAPGLERGALVVRREPEAWVEGRVDCVGIAGCERFQEALYRFVQSSRAAVSPPSADAVRFFTGLRFEPEGASGRLVLDPVQL